MRTLRFYFLTFAIFFFFAPHAFAYKKGIHFYTTFMVAGFCGLDLADDDGVSDALKISWGDYYVDISPQCEAGSESFSPLHALNLGMIQNRKVFHFPTLNGENRVHRHSEAALIHVRLLLEDIRKANAWAQWRNSVTTDPREIAEIEFERSRSFNPILFGMGLHTLQDSWSHEGYHSIWGHLFGGQAPDFPHNDPLGAEEMVGWTWDLMNEWSLLTRGTECPNSREYVQGYLERILRFPFENKEDLQEAWRIEATYPPHGRDLDLENLNVSRDWLETFDSGANRLIGNFPNWD